MAAINAIKITGLVEFKAVVKAMDSNTPKQMKLALNQVATIVVADARRRAPVKTGALRNSIRVASTPTRAQIRMGSARVPYAGFIDYGGKAGPRGKGQGHQVQGRPFIKTGRIMYPAFASQRTLIEAELRKALIAVATTSGAVVTRG